MMADGLEETLAMWIQGSQQCRSKSVTIVAAATAPAI